MTLYDDINTELTFADSLQIREAWPDLTPTERAMEVIRWAQRHGIDLGSVSARPLASAMESADGTQSLPSHYLKLAIAIAAFLRAR